MSGMSDIEATCCPAPVELANGRFRREPTLNSPLRNGVSCEGFRALAYETLQCRNPRAPRAGLWVKRLWASSDG